MSNWISVKDRLPEKDGAYLCYCTGCYAGYQIVAHFTHHAELDFDLNYNGCKGSVWYAYDSEYGNFTMNNITHWMPLPSDPEKKEETTNDQT